MARTRKSMNVFLERINISPRLSQGILLSSWNLAPKTSFLFPVPLRRPQQLRVTSPVPPSFSIPGPQL